MVGRRLEWTTQFCQSTKNITKKFRRRQFPSRLLFLCQFFDRDKLFLHNRPFKHQIWGPFFICHFIHIVLIQPMKSFFSLPRPLLPFAASLPIFLILLFAELGPGGVDAGCCGCQCVACTGPCCCRPCCCCCLCHKGPICIKLPYVCPCCCRGCGCCCQPQSCLQCCGKRKKRDAGSFFSRRYCRRCCCCDQLEENKFGGVNTLFLL